MRKVTLITIIVSLPFLTYSQSGEQKDEVMEVIFELFDGYRVGDSSRVAATFAPGAMMQRISTKEGVTNVSPASSVQGWLDYIGSGLDKMHDEPLWDYSVQINNGLASVWTNYAFYLDGAFSHCGVDNFLLVNGPEGWKIFHVVDTNQREGCDIPEEIRLKSEKSK